MGIETASPLAHLAYALSTLLALGALAVAAARGGEWTSIVARLLLVLGAPLVAYLNARSTLFVFGAEGSAAGAVAHALPTLSFVSALVALSALREAVSPRK